MPLSEHVQYWHCVVPVVLLNFKPKQQPEPHNDSVVVVDAFLPEPHDSHEILWLISLDSPWLPHWKVTHVQQCGVSMPVLLNMDKSCTLQPELCIWKINIDFGGPWECQRKTTGYILLLFACLRKSPCPWLIFTGIGHMVDPVLLRFCVTRLWINWNRGHLRIRIWNLLFCNLQQNNICWDHSGYELS